MHCKIDDLAHCPEHAEQIALWQHQECEREGIASKLSQRRAKLSRHLDPHQPIPRTWLVLINSAPAACLSLISYHHRGQEHRWQPGDPLWVSSVYVLPQHRRQGIARHLLDYAEHRARHLGADSLWLMTEDRQDFYRHLGWQWVRNTRLSGRELSLMQKPFPE
ncbi:MAG TPA: GNAT family N-acetyltransferase [Cellvibrionaceae bacterium]